MSTPRTLGILSPLLGNFYFGQLLRGIQQAAIQQNAHAIAIQTRDAWAPFAEYGRSRPFAHHLAWDHVDGWVIITDAVSPDYVHAIQQTGKPIVLLSWHLPGYTYPAVLPDNDGGVQQLVRHLIEHGHTRIAFVGYLEHPDIRERYTGYQAALLAHGLTPDPDLCIPAIDNQSAGGQSAAEQLLAAGMPCTAVVVGTDMNALALITTLQRAGVRIPEDLAVVGFDDIESAQYSVPALTSMRHRFETLGRRAGEVLLAQLAGADTAGPIHRVPGTLIVRRSCGCTPSGLALPTQRSAPAATSWQEQLAVELVQLALATALMPSHQAPATIWPGVSTLIQGAEAAISGAAVPSDQERAHSWQQAIALTTDLRTLRAMIARLNDLARPQIPPTDARAHTRLDQFLDMALSDLFHARLRAELARNTHFETVMRDTYAVSDAILVGEARQAASLAWLDLTPASYGCLGLWDSTQTSLVIAGMFGHMGQGWEPGSSHLPQCFPPADMLQTHALSANDQLLMLFPARTPQRDWGILAVVGPIEAAMESGRSLFSQATTLLTLVLEREELLQSLVNQQSALREAYERERLLAETIRAIGAPIIPLLPQVLLIPLIGTIDASRAQQVIEMVLRSIIQYQATEVLFDLTGVPLVDTQVAGALIHLTRAAVLLGAQVILVGIGPEIAQSLVSLGVDLSAMSTQPTLAVAIEYLLRRKGPRRSPI